MIKASGQEYTFRSVKCIRHFNQAIPVGQCSSLDHLAMFEKENKIIYHFQNITNEQTSYLNPCFCAQTKNWVDSRS